MASLWGVGVGGPGAGAGGLGAQAGQALAVELFDRLRRLDLVATGTTARREADVAGIWAEVGALVAAWRRLLELHLPLDNGRCPRCHTWDGWRRRRWPCGVWTTAQSYLAEPVRGRP